MNREQLDTKNAAAIRHHYRTLSDNSGQPPHQLLDDLAVIADEYAQGIDSTTLGRPVMPPSETIPVGTEHASAPAKPAPRRTSTRRTAK